MISMKKSAKLFIPVGILLALVVGYCLCVSVGNKTSYYDPDVSVMYVGMVDGDFTYTVFDNYTCEITGYSGADHKLRIPKRINTCPVIGIGNEAFENCDTLIKVVLPDTVSYIDIGAFAECALLKTVKLPRSLEYIGDSAFYKDDCLLSLVCWGELASVGENAFFGCDSLEKAVFKRGVRELGESAFEGCVSLEKLSLGKGLSFVGDHAFSGCESLGKVSLPKGTLGIGIRAFDGCSALETVSVPDSVTDIGRFAFEGTPWRNDAEGYTVVGTGILAAVGADIGPDAVIPEGVRYIGDAFEGRSDIVSVSFPSTLEVIGDGAFKNCTSLRSVSVPDGVSRISSYAFYGCESLLDVVLPRELSDFGQWCFTGTAWEKSADFVIGGDGVLFGCNVAGSCVSVPDGVKYVAEAFYEREYVSVSIPDSAVAILPKAFYDNAALCSVEFGSGLTSVGEEAFYCCTSLTSAVLPSGVKELGDRCFFSCDSLSLLSLPESLEFVGESAFDYCEALTDVRWSRSETAVISDGNEILSQQE